MERSGATWRFWVAGWLFALLLLGLLPRESSHEHVDEWTPAIWVLLLPQVIALTLSGFGIRRGWSPHLLFRFLPLLVLLAFFVFGVALGGC